MTAEKDQDGQGSELLERALYRRRRLVDGIKLLPVLGVGLFVMPILFLGDGGASTSVRLIYFFVCWCAMIALCAFLVRLLRQREEG